MTIGAIRPDGVAYADGILRSSHPDLDLLAELLHPPAFHADALCKEFPDVNFFPERGEDQSAARAICAACLVRDECAAAGLGEHSGIWGGLGERDRRRLRATMPAQARREPLVTRRPRLVLAGAEHGTRRGYKAGCGCDPCRAAHALYARERRTA